MEADAGAGAAGQQSSDNVTSLRGGSVPKSLEVVGELVADLERLLRDARAGKVVAVAAAVQLHNDETGMLIRGRVRPYPVAGALEAAKAVVLQRIVGPLTEQI